MVRRRFKADHERMTLKKIDQRIKNYPPEYPTPKYMLFIKQALEAGLKVTLHEALTTRSKYVYVYNKGKCFKVRFSNHAPALYKELVKDCDFFVGVSNSGVTTTGQAWKAALQFLGMEETNANPG